MVGTFSDPTSLKQYLKKCRINDDKEKKRKKKRKAKPVAAGVIVVDEDPIWQKPLKLDEEEEEEDSADEEKPHVDEDIDVNRSSDISPPRKRRTRNDTPSPEPQQRSNFPASSDLTPPRRSRERYQQVRTAINSLDDHDTADGAPSVSDLSPPRKKVNESPISSRPKSGLISLEDFKDEIDKKRKEDWLRFKEMDPSVSGRGAEPIYRNKLTGECISKEEFLKSRKKVVKKKEKPKEKKLEWGKGLAQKRESEARLQEMEAEKNKPFARSRDDSDLNAMLKERVRWGDPMAHLVKKKHLEPVLCDLGDSEKMKESGFIIPQDIPTQSWIRRGLNAAPNRYGIKPGRHWDGVDRSNGYERQSFKRMNETRATEREAYMWSVSDM